MVAAIAVETETGPIGAAAIETATVLDGAVATAIATGADVMAAATGATGTTMAAWIADTATVVDIETGTDAGETMTMMTAGTGDDIQELHATLFHQHLA